MYNLRRGGGTGLSRCLHRRNRALNDNGNKATAKALLDMDQADIGGLTHGIKPCDRGHKRLHFEQRDGFFHKLFLTSEREEASPHRRGGGGSRG